MEGQRDATYERKGKRKKAYALKKLVKALNAVRNT
jgi:hypothetical protein